MRNYIGTEQMVYKPHKWQDSFVITCKQHEDIGCNGQKCFYFKTCWKGIFIE